MNTERIQFHSEEIDFELKDQEMIRRWLENFVSSFDKELGDINYIFCSDDYLLKINQEHLNHDYYTDIITFDYCENNAVSGDLFISIERTNENAKEFGKTQINELHRVIAHGLLHLLGFKDKTESEEKQMRVEEDSALMLLKSLNP